MTDRPVRPVRPVKTDNEERRPAMPEEIDSYPRTWNRVINGILEMDVEKIHARLEDEIAERVPLTGSAILQALDRVQENFLLAAKLKNRSRREYELFKVEHEQWLEVKKTAARRALEDDKAEKKLTKQITQDMVIDAVRATWPDEYRLRETKVRDFQAAVHTLEDLAEAWKARARALGEMSSIVLSLGPTTVGGKR